MAALAEAKALPPNFGDAIRDAANTGNPFETSRQRELRTKIGTQDTLSLIISKMPGIENAYVLYDVDPKPGGLKDKLITATVCVKPAGLVQLDESRVLAIRHLVSGAIAGLRPENVTVSDLNGRTWYGKPEAQSVEGSRYLALKQTCEQDLKTKILNALCYIPNVTVETNIELTREPVGQTAQPKKHAARDRTANRGAGARAATSQSNTATVLNAILGSSPAAESQADADDNDAADEQTGKPSFVMTPVAARASIGVPCSYLRKVWRERNPANGATSRGPSQVELDPIRIEVSTTIQRHVAPLLPVSGNMAKAAELVAVTTFQDIAEETPAVAVDIRQEVWNWLRQSWRTVFAIVLALLGLMVLRSMAPRPKAAAVSFSELVGDETRDMVEHRPATIPAPHARRFQQSRSGAREELSAIVEEDPDTAANVLRSWIGQVG